MYDSKLKKELLKIAKVSILNEFFPEKYSQPNIDYGELDRKKASFVTLNAEGKYLRGCMGSIIPNNSLWLDVWKNAKNAAFNDHRFNPLTYEELQDDPEFLIEISVLTVPEKKMFVSMEELLTFLENEKPGVLISKGWNQSTFLPDVWEQLPDARSFMNHLVEKSGYNPRNFWMENLDEWDIKLYYTQNWSEKFGNI